jgi:iron complex outermembrane receptor protein
MVSISFAWEKGAMQTSSSRAVRSGASVRGACAGLLLSGLLAVPVYGSTQAGDAAPAEDPDSRTESPREGQQVASEEIVVHAERWPGALLEVGSSVTPFDSEEIEQLALRRAADIATHVPNVVAKESFGNANPIFVIRGVGLADFNANSSPSAGLYLDEVPLVSPLIMGFQLFDIDGIEVLRGPQGTLYGRNTTAGAVTLITRRPSAAPSGVLRMGWGRFDTAELEAAETSALGERWSQRLAFYGKRSDDGPFFNRTLGERRGEVDLLGWRAALDWQSSAATSTRLNLHGGRDRSHGYEFEHLGLLDPRGGFCAPFLADAHDPSQCVDLAGYSDGDGDPLSGDWNLRPVHHHDSLGARVAVDRSGRAMELTSITGWERYDREQWVNADASPQVGLDMRFQTAIEQYSQELRAHGTRTAPHGDLEWLAGAFVSYDRLSGQPNQLFLVDQWLRTRAAAAWRQSTTSAALFGHGKWGLGDRVELGAGARYTWEAKEFRGSTTDLNPFGTSCLLHPTCAPGFVGPVVLSSTAETLSESHLSASLEAEWHLEGRRMLYASIRRGFKSGGFNGGFAASDFELEPYGKETLLAYEAGFKGAFLASRFLLIAALFHYDYRDLQLFAIRTNEAGLPTVVLTNAADARTSGAEVELRAQPGRGFELRLGVGLLDGELEEFQYGAQDLSGNELPNAPDFDADVAVAYRRVLENDRELTLAADYGYTSASFREATNHPVFRADDHGLLGARIALEGRRLGIALWARNLTDERYVGEVFDQRAIGQALRVYGWPRTWGVSFQLHRGPR